MEKRNSLKVAAGLISLALLASGGTAQAGPADSKAYQASVKSRTAEDPDLVWTASQVALKAAEVAPNVFAIYPDDAAAKNQSGVPAATSGGFIIGDNGVLVVESMLNRRLANEVLALIKEKTDKPIRYLVNTSYHGDHSYGNQFFPKGIIFIQHVETQRYIQSHFADDVKFMSQFFGKNQGLDELQPQHASLLLENGDKITVDLGGKQIEIMHLGFAQTAGDLFVWLPKEKVLYTGNPIVAMAPAIPWLLDGHLVEATATLKTLRSMLPDDAVVVPGHGVPTGVKTIDYYIAYLETLKSQVQEAIAKGLSSEETVKTVTMTDYNGYKLYPWVHAQINVPKAYQELKSGS